MATLKKYDVTGKVSGELPIEDHLLEVTVNSQMIKDYLVALRTNARQWSANTQVRSEVNHSKKKPFPQKGTGNARQGFLGAPHFRGGGRVHAPRPKFDQHVRINKKERQLAIKSLYSDKIKTSNVHVLQYHPLEAPKTKVFADLIKALKLQGRRVLFIADESGKEQYQTLSKSLRNLPKVEFIYLPHVSGHDLALCQELIFLEPAMKEFKANFGGKKK